MPAIFAQCYSFARFLIGWGILVVVAVITLGGLYLYDHADENIRQHAEAFLAKQYPHLRVRIRAARLLERQGFEIRGVEFASRYQPNAETPLATVDEILVRCNPRLDDLVRGQVQISEVIARRVHLRSWPNPDGRWSHSELKWCPQCTMKSRPTIRIENSTVDIVDTRVAPARVFSLRDINMALVPQRPVAGASSGNDVEVFQVSASLSGDQLQRFTVQGVVVPAANIWQLAANDMRLAISPALQRSLPLEISESIKPIGNLTAQTSCNVRVAHNPQTVPALTYDVTGVVSGGRLDDASMPYPLSDLTAEFQWDNRQWKLSPIRARYGAATIEASCERAAAVTGSVDPDGTQPLIINGSVTNLYVDRGLMSKMPASILERWEHFQPTGTMDGQFRFVLQGGEFSREIACDFRDVALLWHKFPYPIRSTSGRVVVQQDRVSFDLKGMAKDSPVVMQGNVKDPGASWSGWFAAKSQQPLPIDETLISATSAKTQEIMRAFDADGRSTFAVQIQRDLPGQRPTQSMVFDLVDCRIRHSEFPYPLHQVSGRLERRNDDWQFRNIVGVNDGGEFSCQGDWDHRDGGKLTLHMVGANVPLEEELRTALNPGAQRLWERLQPLGVIDHVAAQYVYQPATRQKNLSLTVRKWSPTKQSGMRSHSLTLTPMSLPYRIDDVSGSVTYRDGKIKLEQLRGKHGRVTVSTGGQARVLPDGAWHVQLENLAVDRLRLDDVEFINAAPKPLARFLNQIALAGSVNLYGGLTLSGHPTQPGTGPVAWSLGVDVENGSTPWGAGVENISGGLRLEGSTQDGQVTCRGDLDIDSLMYRGVQVTDMRGPFWFDGDRLLAGRWAIPSNSVAKREHVTGRAFGGGFTADGQFLFDQLGSFELQTRLLNAEVAQAMREIGHAQPINGRTWGQLRLTGNRLGRHTWKGNGQMALRQTDLYELPVVLAVLKTLRTGSRDRTAFSAADVAFRLEGEHAYVDQVDLRGDTLMLRGVGEVNRKRELDFDLYASVGRDGTPLSAIRPMLGIDSRRFFVIHVDGTAEQPLMTRKVLPGLNVQEWFPDAMVGSEPTVAGNGVNSGQAVRDSEVRQASFPQPEMRRKSRYQR